MTATVEVDDQTHGSLEFAARMTNMTPGQLVARLVSEASLPSPPAAGAMTPTTDGRMVAVYVDYEGHRTHASYDPATTRIDISSGPLGGRSFKTPTGAARAVVAQYKPSVSPNRNGWEFWFLDDGSGRRLKAIRP
jgi:hypothetical protein